MFGFVTEGLPLFGRVNAVEPDFLTLPVVHYSNGIPVGYAENAAGEIACAKVGAWQQKRKDCQRRADRRQSLKFSNVEMRNW